MNPESQKIGMPVINPVVWIAIPAFFFPVSFRIVWAIRFVACVLSRISPRIIPKIMINPIDFIVFPNPVKIVGTTSGKGSVTIAISRAITKIDRKALYFNTEVLMIIRTRPANMVSIITTIYSVRLDLGLYTLRWSHSQPLPERKNSCLFVPLKNQEISRAC